MSSCSQPHQVGRDGSGDVNDAEAGVDVTGEVGEVGEIELDHRNVGEDLSGTNPEGG